MDYAEDVLKTALNVPDGTEDSRNWNGTTTAENVVLGDFNATLTYGCGSGAAKVEITSGPSWFGDVASNSTTKSFTICTN
jgi:hypothetical protein